MPLIKVLLADEEQIMLDALRSLLDGFPDFSVVATSSSGAAALRDLEVHRPHLVLMNLSMPGLGGLETARAIRRTQEYTRIVILTSNQQPVYMREAFQAGANAYLSRKMDADELRTSLLTVHRDGVLLSSSAAGHVLQLISRQSSAAESPLSMLTERERQILFLVAEDNDTEHIARFLSISPKTVRNYLSRIYAKLGTSNRIDTALYAKRSFGRISDDLTLGFGHPDALVGA